MIERVVSRSALHDTIDRRDFEYWLSRPPEERLAAVEQLRRNYYGTYSERLPRVLRVAERS